MFTDLKSEISAVAIQETLYIR